MINISELLKDAPKGMKLYSPIYGEVEFKYIEGGNIIVKDRYGFNRIFSKYGKYFTDYDSECLLFPSKDCRTWEGWKAPTEPEFKVGDWVVRKDGTTFCSGNYAEQITLIEVDGEGKCIWLSSTSWVCDDAIRLWTIADAKDGDVLALNGKPFIYSSHKYGKNYCYIDDCGQFRASFNLVFQGNCVCPATKEQRDLLFAKMQEAGYEWDEKKKELRKIIKPNFKVGDKIEATIYGINWRVTIRGVDKTNRCYLGTHAECIGFSEQDQWHLALKPHYDIANFKVGMPVLVRADNNCRWDYSVFSRITGNKDWPFAVCNGVSFTQCIPFEGNEHLLGTTDMCDKQFINW